MSKLRESAYKILAILEANHERAMLAGGWVRDHIIGRPANDIDIATSATPQLVMQIFKSKSSFQVIPTGIDHGTVTIVVDGCHFELTTLREDVDTDGRHAKVHFCRSFARDAQRRDFTINALYMDRFGHIYDFTSGRDDLNNRRLRFIGKTEERIKEDYLRIMRFFRFWGQLDLYIDKSDLSTIDKLKEGLHSVSQERVLSELFKLFLCPRIEHIVQAMAAIKLLDIVFQGFEGLNTLKTYQMLDVFSPISNLLFEYRMAGLLIFSGQVNAKKNIIESKLKSMKLSNSQVKTISALVSSLELINQIDKDINQGSCLEAIDAMENGGTLRFSEDLVSFWQPLLANKAASIGLKNTAHLSENLSYLIKTEADCGSLRKSFPLTGKDLVASLKLQQGPEIGKILVQLRRDYLNGEWLKKSDGIQLAKNYIKKDRGINPAIKNKI